MLRISGRQARWRWYSTNQEDEEHGKEGIHTRATAISQRKPIHTECNTEQVHAHKRTKEKILAMAEGGMSIAHIIRELGYDPDVLGRHRIKGLVGKIRMEAESPQGVRGGYARRTTKRLTAGQNAELEENPESYAKLKREVVYLREEVEFLKKISQQAISGKRGK